MPSNSHDDFTFKKEDFPLLLSAREMTHKNVWLEAYKKRNEEKVARARAATPTETAAAPPAAVNEIIPLDELQLLLREPRPAVQPQDQRQDQRSPHVWNPQAPEFVPHVSLLEVQPVRHVLVKNYFIFITPQINGVPSMPYWDPMMPPPHPFTQRIAIPAPRWPHGYRY